MSDIPPEPSWADDMEPRRPRAGPPDPPAGSGHVTGRPRPGPGDPALPVAVRLRSLGPMMWLVAVGVAMAALLMVIIATSRGGSSGSAPEGAVDRYLSVLASGDCNRIVDHVAPEYWRGDPEEPRPERMLACEEAHGYSPGEVDMTYAVDRMDVLSADGDRAEVEVEGSVSYRYMGETFDERYAAVITLAVADDSWVVVGEEVR